MNEEEMDVEEDEKNDVCVCALIVGVKIMIHEGENVSEVFDTQDGH